MLSSGWTNGNSIFITDVSTTHSILGGEEMRIIKTYKPCEQCLGTGLETNGRIFREEGYQSWECRVCQGYGEILLNVRKEIAHEQPKPERH